MRYLNHKQLGGILLEEGPRLGTAVRAKPFRLVRTGGRRRLRLCRVQTVELRFVVKRDEIRITPSPRGVLEPRLPGLTQGIQGFRLSLQLAVQTSRIVKNRSFVGAQSNRQVEFAQGVVRPS